ncbi:hypothetical protein ABKA04_001131 [Annulohypoxylon sp. FPYF3050]
MRVWYTYRDCGASTIADMATPTDLYVHKRYWLDKLTTECLEAGMYEPTMSANGQLSDWTAQPVLVAKDREAEIQDPWLEPRMTVNYSKVEEDLPGTNLPLLADLHAHLSDPRIGSISKFDLKHGYWSILVHPDTRHILAFEIPGFPQLQPTRMPQGTQSAAHSMSEMMRIMLGHIPEPNPEPSFIAPSAPDALTCAVEYIDDVFATHKTVEDQLDWIEHHFLPRILWARLKLSFRKVFIGCEEVVALGTVHKTQGRMSVKPGRAEKLRQWPVPTEPTEVRRFLGALGPTRRWIRNCSELSRPLTRLAGNVPWKWSQSEAISFNILREKAADTTEMHGHIYDLPVEMFSDASAYAGGCFIRQMQDGICKPILYDSFLFVKTQRNYGTYKRELCTIVEFSRRHERYLRSPIPSIIYTDHKPLTFFLVSPNVEGIYARWADELKSLNILIVYVPGEKNQVADALSRTIFRAENCEDDFSKLGHVDSTGEWIWKDGKNGYEALLKSLEPEEQQALIQRLSNVSTSDHSVSSKLCSHMAKVWNWSDDPATGFEAQMRDLLAPDCVGTDEEMWHCLSQPSVKISSKAGVILSCSAQVSSAEYAQSVWYRDVWNFLNGLSGDLGRLGFKTMQDRSSRFRLRGDHLEHCHRGIWRRCLLEREVSKALQLAHDDGGHFSPSITLKRLNQTVYWPCMAQDTADYYLGCLHCAEFNPAKPKSADLPVTICQPFQVVVMDFIGPFEKTKRGNMYILCMVDTFGRYAWAYPTKDQQAPTAVECVSKWVDEVGTIPLAVYADPGSAFISKDFVESLRKKGIFVHNSPSTSHKSIGLVEVFNKIVQIILSKLVSSSGKMKKNTPIPQRTYLPTEVPQTWDDHLATSVRQANSRYMQHIGYSPFEIIHGCLPRGEYEIEYPPSNEDELRTAISKGTFILPPEPEWNELVVRHIARMQWCQESVRTEHEIRRAQRENIHLRKGREETKAGPQVEGTIRRGHTKRQKFFYINQFGRNEDVIL